MSDVKNKPGDMLVGLTLNEKWRVLEKRQARPEDSGGVNSIQYYGQDKNGRGVFIKALDISDRMRAAGPRIADELQYLTWVFTYERDLLDLCKDCSRIVVALDSGTVPAGTIPGCYEYPVFFLVFERAAGDARSQANIQDRLGLAKMIRSLHHVTVGLQQLHQRKIAHQDLKPSNVLFYSLIQGPFSSKVADVGRASHQGGTTPYDNLPFPGDPWYTPPELLYRYVDLNWHRCRLGADLYLLGSLVVAYFCGVSMTALFHEYLAPEHRADVWSGTYDEVLPYVRHAYETAMIEHVRPELETYLASTEGGSTRRRASAAEDLYRAIRELSEPDPKLRGHPNDRRSNQYALFRYISLFDKLATAVEIGRM